MQDEVPQSSAEVVRRAVGLISARLPNSWKVETASEPWAESVRPDALIKATAPNGTTVRLVLEGRLSAEKRDLNAAIAQLRSRVDSDSVPVIAARYLSPSARELLDEQNTSYVDATGNLKVICDDPALFLSDRGLDRDPWRGAGRPRGTLKGEPAARVVRTLIEQPQQVWRTRQLIERSGASTGATYRVLDYLQRETLIDKVDEGYVLNDWQRLLRMWARDSSFLRINRVARFIEPRGVNALLSRLASTDDMPYALTGSAAASEWAPYAPAKAIYLYVPSIEEAAERWELRMAATAPNVLLIEPKSPKDPALEGVRRMEGGIAVASPVQVAADLLNGPGREPAEGDELIRWMSDNEEVWRRGG